MLVAMSLTARWRFGFSLLVAGLWLPCNSAVVGIAAPPSAQEDPRANVEIARPEGILRVEADRIERLEDDVVMAEGDVVVTWQDARLVTATMRYDPNRQLLELRGGLELTRGKTWLKGVQADLDLENDTGIIEQAEGFTDEELYVNVERLIKIGPRTYLAENGWVTACDERVPKWSFSIRKATINLDGMAHLKHTIFRVKRVPLLYFPYLLLPTEKKERSSGFLLPTLGDSSTKGRRVTTRGYLVLGRSADVFLEQDYYSLRGWGGTFNLRARPNDVTFVDLTGRFVDDRLGQGGSELEGVMTTRLSSTVRAAADFDLVSNFRYRQTFSDNFFTATRPTETSRFFLTNNMGRRSLNLVLTREETRTSGANIVTEGLPSLELRLLGERLSHWPVYLELEGSVGAVGRKDGEIETPRVSQRIDLFPTVYTSFPLFQGLRITPSFGVRQTFYSDSITRDLQGERRVSGDSFHRSYVDLTVDVGGWGLARVYPRPDGSRWKHLIEPYFRYRVREGVDDFDSIIRFDYLDAVADTHSVEYGVWNRWFVKRSETSSPEEWLAIGLVQQHFLDSTFGDSITEGKVNQFYPLNDLTGLPYALGPRDFSPVSLIARLRPASFGRLDWRADYDPEEGEWNNLSITGSLGKGWWNAGGTYFITRSLSDQIGKGHQFQGRLHMGNVGRGWSAAGYVSLDLRTNEVLNHNVRVNYFWNCCGVSMEYWGFRLRTREENQVRFSLYLKGIGTFGTIRQPEIVF